MCKVQVVRARALLLMLKITALELFRKRKATSTDAAPKKQLPCQKLTSFIYCVSSFS
jgi:hypothetical protein